MSSNRILRHLAAVLATLAVLACSKPVPVHPALWQVDGPHGQRAWLFGTIHALPDPVDWHSPPIDAALAASDRMVVEVARIEEAGPVFARLSRSTPQPPARERITPTLRPAFDRLLDAHQLAASQLDPLETWAVALMLQQALARDADIDSAHGVDRALVASYPRRIEELEGATRQLAIFDSLAEADQRALLESVVRDSSASSALDDAMTRGWAKGDLSPIAAETRRGFMADPELRAALLTNRNRAWSQRLAQLIQRGARPFVAVGAAHMTGPDGLPALLTQQGFVVRRIQ
ncbi:MAG: hypothetical protein RIQ99_2044 [Pseudomonadota bacterium]